MNAPVSFAKDRVRILLLEGIHPSAVDTFRAAGYNNVELLPTALNEADLIEKIKGVHFLGIRSRTQLTRKSIRSRRSSIGCRLFLHWHQSGGSCRRQRKCGGRI